MLTTDELKKRIFAARILRGVTQAELQQSLADEGLGKQELGRIERGDLPLTRVRRVALARILRVPEDWFTSENVDKLVGHVPAEGPNDEPPLDSLTAEEALDQLKEATRAMQAMLGRLGRDVGRRDLESRPETDQIPEDPQAPR